MAVKKAKPEDRARRITKDLAVLREAVKPTGYLMDNNGIPVRRETLRYLLEAHDTFPGVVRGLAADFQQVVVACREAADLLEKGRT